MNSNENPNLSKLTSVEVKKEIDDKVCLSENLRNLGTSIHEEMIMVCLSSDAELIDGLRSDENDIGHYLKQEPNSSLVEVMNSQKNPNLEKSISVEINKQIEDGFFSVDKLLNLGSLIHEVKQQPDTQKTYRNEPIYTFGYQNQTQIDQSSAKSDFVPETQPEPNIVPEKQPITTKRKHRKKQATTSAPEGTVRKSEKWTIEEEVALARAWVDLSEKPKIDYWKRIREKFHNIMGRGEYRTPDMISSKWRDIRLKVEKFNEIYNKNFNNRRSGTSDLNIFQDSCDEYKTEMGLAFSLNKVWEVVRSCAKWENVPLMGQSSKRTKTSSSGKYTSQASSHVRCQINHDDMDDELEAQEEPICLPGKNNKGKQVTSSNKADYKIVLDNISSKMSKLLELMREKQEYSDLKLLCVNIDHLTGQDRELVEKRKQEIRDKYRN